MPRIHIHLIRLRQKSVGSIDGSKVASTSPAGPQGRYLNGKIRSFSVGFISDLINGHDFPYCVCLRVGLIWPISSFFRICLRRIEVRNNKDRQIHTHTWGTHTHTHTHAQKESNSNNNNNKKTGLSLLEISDIDLDKKNVCLSSSLPRFTVADPITFGLFFCFGFTVVYWI